ncbi:MAG: hypothetical protein CMI30_10860 [Opitutae bacterium]|nr:hypothetical protein [Opitutae bacterium]|tara:strand:+ start:10170 stop:11009 length:840 start_codon:yes stop_codon:yes gene_type:complete
MSVVRDIPTNAVVLRTGGLGDFILTVPLLVSLAEMQGRVAVATRRQYYDVLGPFRERITFIEADELLLSQGGDGLDEKLRGATVFSFWEDSDGFLESQLKRFGIEAIVKMESRPQGPRHFVEETFQDAGIQWVEECFSRSWLSHRNLRGNSLWVHPGSGSGCKNAPVSWFLHRIENWLAQGQGRVAFVSFGEADAEVEKQFLLDGGALPLRYVRPDSLQEFSQLLVDEAALFIGNDSGPAHLAASLGIPTEVVFVSTDPEIWRPLGEVVEVLRLDSRIN